MRPDVAVTLLVLVVLVPAGARADGGAEARFTFFAEPGHGTQVTDMTPQIDVHQDLGDDATVSAGYQADVVSGATERVVDAPGVDVISSASFQDLRHSAHGTVELRHDVASLSGTYTYSTERDYRSHAFALTAATEILERDTRLALTYARSFDSVCNLAQPRARQAVERQALDSSEGCFTQSALRTESDFALHTLQGSWTQAWSSVLAMQITATAQLGHGFQTNPYRAVWLGRGAAQEHAPEDRARYAIGVRANYWLRPLRGALQLFGRVYRDTWDIESITAELAYEQYVGSSLRLRARGRYYNQSAAAFYSDDYGLAPRGQYFVGDRELSKFSSWMLGARAQLRLASSEGRVAGLFGTVDLVASFDWMLRDYVDFHLGGHGPVDNHAFVVSLGVDVVW